MIANPFLRIRLGGGTPGGLDTEVQFNDGGAFGGDAGLTFNKTTNALTTGSLALGGATIGSNALAVTGTELLTGTKTITGGTVTVSTPVIDATQTWNAGGVTFVGKSTNITATASATLSLVERWQVGGTDIAGIVKDGSLFATLGIYKSAATSFNGANYHGFSFSGSNIDCYSPTFSTTAPAMRIGPAAARGADIPLGVGFGASVSTIDTFLIRSAAANLQLGAADAAAPVAQTLSVQSVVTGTANTAGANFTIKGSAGTGSAAGGSLIFQVAPAGGAGSTPNAFVTALSISGAGEVVLGATSQQVSTSHAFVVGQNLSVSSGSITAGGRISSNGANALYGIGYSTGAGGTVTQATSKSTGATLNTQCGAITLNSASLAANTTVGFVLTNSCIEAGDMVFASIKSGATADSYSVTVGAISAGSCRIELRNNTGGALAEAVVLVFSIFKGATS